MNINIVSIEGFKPEYTGGGAYLNNIYQFITYKNYFKPTVNTLNRPFYFTGSSIFFYLLNYSRIKRNLEKNLKNIEKDSIVHNNNVIPLPRIKRSKVVTTIHHIFFKMNLSNNKFSDMEIIHFLTEGFMINNSDYIIAVSNLTKKKILRCFSFPEEKIKVIHNGVNKNIFFPRNLTEENFILFPNALRYPLRKGTFFIIQELEQQYRGQVFFLQINEKINQQAIAEFGVGGYPNMLLIYDKNSEGYENLNIRNSMFDILWF